MEARVVYTGDDLETPDGTLRAGMEGVAVSVPGTGYRWVEWDAGFATVTLTDDLSDGFDYDGEALR